MEQVEKERNRTIALLEPLFRKAQEVDEFEYACTLLRVRGAERAGLDALVEGQALVSDMLSLIQSPLNDPTKLRLALLLYVHIVEMKAPYHVIINMLRVTQGERYNLAPFGGARYPEGRIRRIKAASAAADFPEVGTHFDTFYSKEIRNAFAHSGYVIHGDEFNIVGGKGIEVSPGVISHSVSAQDYVLPRIQRAVDYGLGFFELMSSSRRAYKEPKVVNARLGPDGQLVNATLLVESDEGLVGFEGTIG